MAYKDTNKKKETKKKPQDQDKKKKNKKEKQEKKKQEKKESKKEKEEKKKEKDKEEKKEAKGQEEKGSKEKQKESKKETKKEIPEFGPGDLIKVYQEVERGGKTYTQIFKGIVIARKHGKGLNATFTVRKEATGGVGVEKIFPLHLPAIQKIEVVKRHKVRRSKLYYLRNNKKKLKEKK